MALINWDESFSVKIDSIDKQHQQLVSILNEFYDNIKIKSGDDLKNDLIRQMKDYTIIHFDTEEKLFQRYDFPDYEEHKKEHDEFVKKVEKLEKRFLSGKMILTLEITDFLKDWLTTHIKGTDMQYSEYLRSRGVV